MSPDENRHTPAFGGSGGAETRHTPAFGEKEGDGFGARLQTAMGARGALCVGIDPHPELLHAWGLPADAAGLERFALSTVDALGGMVAVLKPQSAFFESYGARGVAVLERTIAAARDAGALVLLDVKRGDIGSTMAAYAAAYLTEGSPLAADAVTLSPYLGFESLRPALDAAAASRRGVFVLARTSNRDGAPVQDAVHSDSLHRPGGRDSLHRPGGRGRTVAQYIVDGAAAENAGAGPLGDVGVVIGATAPHGLDLTHLNGPVLAPGLGVQGANAEDLRTVFGSARAVLPSTSRDVLRHGPDPAALRRAANAVLAELITR